MYGSRGIIKPAPLPKISFLKKLVENVKYFADCNNKFMLPNVCREFVDFVAHPTVSAQ